MTNKVTTVAKYLETQLAFCGKSQREVATDIGYTNPNIITMFKLGSTKIPINKVSALAKSLGVDPIFMLRMVMSEYMPEAWEQIEAIIGADKIISEQELALVQLVKEVAGNKPFDLSIADNRRVMTEAIETVVSSDQERGAAAVRRIESLPKNSRNK